MSLRSLRLTLIVACVATCASCISFRGPEDLRRDLARSAGVEPDRETGITIGRLGMIIARMATDDDDISLRGVRKVEVGVYEVVGDRRGTGERRPLELPGWETVVRVRDEGDDVFVLIEPREGQIRRLLVIVADEDEWVLVRVRGRLNGFLEHAMRMAFHEADRPELYAPAMADYRSRQAAPEAGG